VRREWKEEEGERWEEEEKEVNNGIFVVKNHL